MLLALLLTTSLVSPHGAIATAHPLASEAGAAELRRGGNAVDAAVAAAFSLAVVEPGSSGIGGGGFALVYLAREGKVYVLDFREVGPKAARPDLYVRDGQVREDLALDGPLSVAVPGAVRGYTDLAQRFGRRPLSELTAAAEQQARHGFRASAHLVHGIAERQKCLEANPDAARIFLVRDADGELAPPEPGDRIVQADLARTLHAIGQSGASAFYRGALARRMVQAVRDGGGILSLADLASFRSRELAPLWGTYRGYRVATMPPPSSGGVIVLGVLNALELEDPQAGGYRPERFAHAMIEAEKELFAAREQLGDALFNPEVAGRVQTLIGKPFAREVHARIGERARTPAQVRLARESPQTTHISVIDEEGNAVALTTTINYGFGSCFIPQGTGVLLNDEMDDFAVAPNVPNAYGALGSTQNFPGPGKVPLSSMAPTLVFTPQGSLRLAIGAPGGTTIPTTVLQVIQHVIDDRMPIDRALSAPRLHEQLGAAGTDVEANGLEAATAKALLQRGQKLNFLEPRERLGNAQAVAVLPETGYVEAASDPRGDGAPAAP